MSPHTANAEIRKNVSEKDRGRQRPLAAGAADVQEASAGSAPAKEEEAGEEMSTEDEAKVKREHVELSTKTEEYYESCLRWARTWMVLFIGFLLIALFLVTGLALIWFAKIDGELLEPQTLAGKVITSRNVTALMIILLLADLLVLLAARFNRRWRLYHSTMESLAKLRIHLSRGRASGQAQIEVCATSSSRIQECCIGYSYLVILVKLPGVKK
jgi:hypothetical protein